MISLPEDNLLLAGDIGGTKSNLATFRVMKGKLGFELVIVENKRFPSNDYPSLGAIIREFLGNQPKKVVAAGFGIPGPVDQGRAKPTNISWAVDAHEIAEEFKFKNVELLNDLAANAYGINELKATDFEVIHPGSPSAKGNRCVVSPGTGLGEAGLFWDGKRHQVWACEGGHTDFAPNTEIEIQLLQYLRKQLGHISVERVVSGIGLYNIYRFLRDTERGRELPEVAAALKVHNPGRVITDFAESGTCSLCIQTIEIFISCLGAEAGNMALKSMAVGGVYLGGGIPIKLLSRIRSAAFLNAFISKGRLSSLLKTIPIRVILNDQAALLGAARFALECLIN